MEEAVESDGVPVWSHDGIVCTGETYKNAVKLTFAHGAFCRIHLASSIPASKATCDARSTSTRATRSTEGAQGAHQGRGEAQ